MKRVVGHLYLNSHKKSELNGNKTLNNTIKWKVIPNSKKNRCSTKNMATSVKVQSRKQNIEALFLISSRRSKNSRPPNIIFTIDIREYMVWVNRHRLDRDVS